MTRLWPQRAPRERPEPAAGGEAPTATAPTSAWPSAEPRVLVALAAGLAAGILSWVALSYHGWTRHAASATAVTTTTGTTTTSTETVAPVGPLGLAAAALRTKVAALGQPVYWVGPEKGVTYELKRTGDGSVFLRYLPHGVPVGSSTVVRTIGTYPFPGAYSAVHRLSQEADTVWFTVRDGGIGVYRRSRPTNVYLAWPGLDYQVEVFDPQAVRALELARSPLLRRIAGA